MIHRVPRPDAEDPLLIVGNPIKLSGMPETEPTGWPRLGEHTDEILRAELGISDRELHDLHERGAVGPRFLT
jgi:crotonobetainyl-CoA:carnitine CoA-transferase CaiB-like acyl-CoA transferase